jgi:hypothetical protein
MATPALLALALMTAVAACGSSSNPSGPSGPSGVPAAPGVIATPQRSAGDLEVARVNGRSVWASCVAAQAQTIDAARAPDRIRGEALDQCIAFELLAQAAEARGLAAAPEVSQAARTAAVDRLIEADFEQRYRTPDDLKPAVDAVMKRNEWRLHVPELRSSAYARFVVPKDAPPELDARAHALADRLAAQLAGEAGLYSVHLSEAAHRIAAGTDVKLETADVNPTERGRLVDSYATALYTLPAVGRTSQAVRTDWGYDVVLWTGGIAAAERTRDEVVAELFPELRRHQFQLWAAQLARQLGVHIEVDQAGVAELDSGAAP